MCCLWHVLEGTARVYPCTSDQHPCGICAGPSQPRANLATARPGARAVAGHKADHGVLWLQQGKWRQHGTVHERQDCETPAGLRQVLCSRGDTSIMCRFFAQSEGAAFQLPALGSAVTIFVMVDAAVSRVKYMSRSSPLGGLQPANVQTMRPLTEGEGHPGCLSSPACFLTCSRGHVGMLSEEPEPQTASFLLDRSGSFWSSASLHLNEMAFTDRPGSCRACCKLGDPSLFCRAVHGLGPIISACPKHPLSWSWGVRERECPCTVKAPELQLPLRWAFST